MSRMRKAMKDADTYQYKVEGGAFAKGQLMQVVKSGESAQSILTEQAGTLTESDRSELKEAVEQCERARARLRELGVKNI